MNPPPAGERQECPDFHSPVPVTEISRKNGIVDTLGAESRVSFSWKANFFLFFLRLFAGKIFFLSGVAFFYGVS
jgi:hypothetical protein